MKLAGKHISLFDGSVNHGAVLRPGRDKRRIRALQIIGMDKIDIGAFRNAGKKPPVIGIGQTIPSDFGNLISCSAVSLFRDPHDSARQNAKTGYARRFLALFK